MRQLDRENARELALGIAIQNTLMFHINIGLHKNIIQ